MKSIEFNAIKEGDVILVIGKEIAIIVDRVRPSETLEASILRGPTINFKTKQSLLHGEVMVVKKDGTKIEPGDDYIKYLVQYIFEKTNQ